MRLIGTHLIRVPLSLLLLLPILSCVTPQDGRPYPQGSRPYPQTDSRQYAMEIRNRITIQQRRINNGYNQRRLTRQEAFILHENVGYIDNRLREAMARRRLGAREAAELHRLLDDNNRMIATRDIRPFRRY